MTSERLKDLVVNHTHKLCSEVPTHTTKTLCEILEISYTLFMKRDRSIIALRSFIMGELEKRDGEAYIEWMESDGELMRQPSHFFRHHISSGKLIAQDLFPGTIFELPFNRELAGQKLLLTHTVVIRRAGKDVLINSIIMATGSHHYVPAEELLTSKVIHSNEK